MQSDKDNHTRTDSNSDIPIFTKSYEFYKKLSVIIPSFPKTKRYTLGQKLDNISLELIELLFSIPISTNKMLILQRMSIKIDLLKVLLRLSKDTQAINDREYLELQEILAEIGRMLGGWIKSTKQNIA